MPSKLAPHLGYGGYDLTPFILPLIRREFLQHAPNLEILTRLWRRILALWRPKLLYINNSYGRSAVSALIAAEALNIRTIEQQHGVIGRNHFAYLVPRHQDLDAEFPLCDKMVVWGEHTKRFLVERGVYKSEDVAVCGFPRIDALLGGLPIKSETLGRLGIPTDAQVALYTSNEFAHGFLGEILDSIRRVKDASNVYWIVKLHPRERTRHIWQSEIDRRQLESVRVVEGSHDFYALLAACDVHVSFASTTLIESAILGKPNLGLDIPHTSDPAGYAQARAFLPVPPSQLGTAVHTILGDPEKREVLLREQKRFADDWCLHDGRAADRIVRLIEEMQRSK